MVGQSKWDFSAFAWRNCDTFARVQRILKAKVWQSQIEIGGGIGGANLIFRHQQECVVAGRTTTRGKLRRVNTVRAQPTRRIQPRNGTGSSQLLEATKPERADVQHAAKWTPISTSFARSESGQVRRNAVWN